MSYRFACGNVVPGCPGEVRGESVDEVLGHVATHARDAHGITEIDDTLVDAVKAGIEETD